MSDLEKLINASDLIEWIIETDPDWCVGSVRCIIDHIDKMPSAQPVDKDMNVPCTDTIDTISRSEAIDDFTKWKYQLADCFGEDYSGVSIVESAIKSLEGYPSAQPEEDCDTCIHGYFGDSQCNNCRVGYPSHYERRTDDSISD